MEGTDAYNGGVGAQEAVFRIQNFRSMRIRIQNTAWSVCTRLDLWSQIRITLMRSRIRIRTRIRMKVKSRSRIRIDMKRWIGSGSALKMMRTATLYIKEHH
jgi:hypothetical protein